MMNRYLLIAISTLLLFQCSLEGQYREPQAQNFEEEYIDGIENMLAILLGDEEISTNVLNEFDTDWKEGYRPMLLEVM